MSQFKLPFPKITGWTNSGTMQLNRNMDEISTKLSYLPIWTTQTITYITSGGSSTKDSYRTAAPAYTVSIKGDKVTATVPGLTGGITYSQTYIIELDIPNGTKIISFGGKNILGARGTSTLTLIKSKLTDASETEITHIHPNGAGTYTVGTITGEKVDLTTYNYFIEIKFNWLTILTDPNPSTSYFYYYKVGYTDYESYF
jgi:hypothetical protein